jgi:hypothetical protein
MKRFLLPFGAGLVATALTNAFVGVYVFVCVMIIEGFSEK